MKLTAILLLALIPLAARAQNNYTQAIQQGDAALRRGEYKTAIKKYFAAEAFDPSQKDAVQQKVEKVFDKIEDLRKEAANALKALENTSHDAVRLLLKEIDRNILHLEYDQTLQKCQTVAAYKVERTEVEKRIWEIVYFYTESNMAKKAVPYLRFVNPSGVGISSDSPELQTEMRTYLKRAVPEAYLAFLKNRYYPATVLVEGGACVRQQNKSNFRVNVPTFRLGETEVTFWQYNLFVQSEGQTIPAPCWQFVGDNPAVNVSWYDAARYLNWFSARHGKQAVYTLTEQANGTFEVTINYNADGYRLPTEAEWEFAARGGNKSANVAFSGDSSLTAVGWYFENSNARTQAVRQKKANELGLYDMSGNAWEWCNDWYESYDLTATDNPRGPDSGEERVVRGGCFNNSTDFCQPAHRGLKPPQTVGEFYGFRVAGPSR